ncbi:metal-dependent hydrolase family protein [Pseudoduganella sp. OTU4001]|uniref:metal-dependent hydrolase family protein n=1 Tax=Pseudoduganella sp. OTU4001 TaxID=3043854 RepID=UPI00313B4B58
MKKLGAASLLLAMGSASAMTVDCGRLLDVKAGVWREKVTVHIENGSVKSIEPTKGKGDVDMSGMSCMPGFIDMHVHLTSQTMPQVESLRGQLTLDAADRAYDSVAYAERTLKAGFTTVRDLGANEGLNIAMKRAINSGAIIGPRMFTGGKTIATTGGHGDPSNGKSRELRHLHGTPGPNEGVINSPDEARQAVRARYQEGADVIKITATGGVLSQASSGMNSQFDDAELKALIAAAKDYGFKVAAHAHGTEGLKRALKAGVDSIEHGTFMDDECIALFKKNGAWFVPTISAGRFVADKAKEPNYYSPLVRPKAAAIGPQIQGTFARAYKAGVKIAFGTDAGVFPHGDNAKEFAYMVEAGMPALEAIRSATLGAASLLGQSSRLGSLEPGYAADIVAVAGDPLQDITLLQKVGFVMKEGVVYKQ